MLRWRRLQIARALLWSQLLHSCIRGGGLESLKNSLGFKFFNHFYQIHVKGMHSWNNYFTMEPSDSILYIDTFDFITDFTIQMKHYSDFLCHIFKVLCSLDTELSTGASNMSSLNRIEMVCTLSSQLFLHPGFSEQTFYSSCFAVSGISLAFMARKKFKGIYGGSVSFTVTRRNILHESSQNWLINQSGAPVQNCSSLQEF